MGHHPVGNLRRGSVRRTSHLPSCQVGQCPQHSTLACTAALVMLLNVICWFCCSQDSYLVVMCRGTCCLLSCVDPWACTFPQAEKPASQDYFKWFCASIPQLHVSGPSPWSNRSLKTLCFYSLLSIWELQRASFPGRPVPGSTDLGLTLVGGLCLGLPEAMLLS